MNKRVWIPIAVTLLLLAILFLPVPAGTLNDGGTRVYSAVTYKIVAWNKVTDDDMVYDDTRIYFGKDRLKDISQLWALESETIEHEFKAVIKEINGEWVTVEPLKGETECTYSLKIEFQSANLPKINANVGDTVNIQYVGNVSQVEPVRINHVTAWSKVYQANDD